MLEFLRTADTILESGYSLDCSYYLFCGSHGDKWYIASMLGHLFEYDEKAYVISSHEDRELLRIFLGERMNRVAWVDEDSVLQIKRICQADANSYMPPRDSATTVQGSPQRGCIRSLHLVDYPYFAKLLAHCFVKYSDAQKMIMCLPQDTRMEMPNYINCSDEELVEVLLDDAGLLNCKSAILNPVNFSNQPLSFDAWSTICDLLRQHGYQFAFNIAQSPDPEMGEKLKDITGASILSMPGHLMKSIYDKITLCLGAYGGGMAIADGFGVCNVFTFYTKFKFFPGANNLNVDFHDFHNCRAEPRPLNSRLSRASSYFSDISTDDINLIKTELFDMLRLID